MKEPSEFWLVLGLTLILGGVLLLLYALALSF